MRTITVEKARRRGRPHAPVTYNGHLRKIRESSGFTQPQLSEASDIPQNSISIAERTGEGLSEENWKKLAAILHSDVLTLRGWEKIFAE